MARTAKLTKQILTTLFMGGAILIALASPGGAQKLIRGIRYEIKRKRERDKLFWTIAYLRRKKYVDFKEEIDGSMRITLTESGHRRALKYHLETLTLERRQSWDGKWRLIAFDIPEKRRAGRNALREKMRELGLIQLQKSLWVWPYECKDEIDFLAEVFEIGPYVHYIVAESVTSEKFLKYKFNFI